MSLYAETNTVNNEPLYTEDDLKQKPSTHTGNYSIVKGIANVANPNQEIPEKVNFDLFVHDQWKKTVGENNMLDKQAIVNAASTGDVPIVEEAFRTINERNRMLGEESYQLASDVRAQLKELTSTAVEKSVSNNLAVLFNNDPQKVYNTTNKVINSLSAQAAIERINEDGNSLTSIVTGFLYEFTPFAAEQGAAIDRVAEKYGVPAERISRATGRSETRARLQAVFRTVPENQRGEWLTNLYNDLKDSVFISDWQAAYVALQVASSEEVEWDGVEDWLDRLGVVGAAASVFFAAAKATNLFKMGNSIKNAQRSIAMAGGKEAIVTAEATKLATYAANKHKFAAAGTVIGELSGITAALDLTKLVSMSAAKVLPETVSTAASKLQQTIREPVERLITELQDTIAGKGIRAAEAEAELFKLRQVYSSANNPNIKSVDPFVLSPNGLSVTSKVLYKPANSSSFLTKEAAEAYIQAADPANKHLMKVVPDTTNEGFLVEESVKKNLELQRTALTAELADAAKTIAADKPTETKAIAGVVKLPWVEIIGKAADNLNDEFIKIGNNSLQTGTHQRLLVPFLDRMNKLLGLESREFVVMQMSSLLKSTDPNMKAVANFMNQRHTSSSAVHFPISANKSVIVMRNDPIIKGDSSSLRRYMETFAHEYGHAFEAAFSRRYSPILMSSFNKWLRAKNIKWTGNEGIGRAIEAVPFEAMLEYRNITTGQDLIKYVDDWFSGNKKAYMQSEKALRRWTSLYSEFFAENFSKWAFSDKIPTDALGQAFKALVDGFKEIARQIIEAVKVASNGKIDLSLEADKNIATMLREHVKMVQKGQIQTEYNLSRAASESKSISRSMESIAKELEAVEEEIAAIKAAEDGLTTGWLVEMPISKTIDYTAISKYNPEDIESAVRFSMGDWALSTSKELYEGRYVGINQQSRYIKLLTNFVRPSLESLNKKEMGTLVDALVLGDKEGKVFSVQELAGMQMSERSRDAYYKVRALRDVMHQIRNDVAAKSLARQGYLDIKTPLKTVIPGKFFGKETTVVTNNIVFDGMTNQSIRVTDDYISAAEKQGIVFYESIEPIMIDGKYRKVFAFERSKIETSLPKEVIPYRKGEYRRIYSDEYFVKITSEMDVDGKLQSVTSTHRTAVSAKEANAYVAAFKKAVALHKEDKLDLAEASKLMEPYGWRPDTFIEELDSGKFGSQFDISVKYNRTDDDYVNETIGISQNFSSARGDRVLSVRGEDTVNTLNPIDSIAAEIGNTAYVASTNEWREAHVIRWFNTFREDLPLNVRDMSPEQAFVYMYNNKGFYAGQTKNLQVAEKVQDYIVAQLNIPSTEEKNFIGAMRMISEGIEGKVGNKSIEKVGMLLRATKDYPTFMRTIAFNSFFAFNPVQFFMQGMNAFNAIAISPIHGLKAAKTSSFYALALFSDQPEIWAQVAKANKLTSFGLDISNDDFVEVVRAIRRSGLLDGMNTTSLYGAETGKYGMFNKWTRRARTMAATPFNSGEGLSRIVSFDIARREFIAANPGKAWWLDDNMSAILKRQDDLTQNMTSANKTNWQTGWKSIPTQFVQYQVKLLMNVVQSILGNKRTFTRQEALLLFTMHGAVMGTSGMILWPFRDILTDMLPENMTEEERLYVQQGVVAGMISSITDGDVQLGLGSRFNTFKYYEDLLKGILDPEKNFLEVLGGPSGFAATRILGGGFEGVKLLVKAPMTMETLNIAMQEIGKSSFSAFNNVYKAKLAKENYNRVMSNSGKAMYTVSDGELFALAMGIPPARQEDYNILYESRKAHQDELANAGKVVAKHAMLGLTALRNNDRKSYEVHAAIIQSVLNLYDGADYRTLLSQAYKTDSFTQFEKMAIDQMVKGYKKQDLTVKE